MILHMLAVLLIFCSYCECLSVPRWADSYTVMGIIQLPYAEIKEDFKSFYDSKNNRSRIDYYGKTVITIQDVGQANGVSYKIAPMTTETQYNVHTCFKVTGSTEIPVQVQAILPDLSQFKLIDKSFTGGKHCNVWFFEETIEKKKNSYSMHVDASTNEPVRYEMFGMNILLGSHYDRYYIDYQNYIVTPLPDDDFLPPKDITKCRQFPGPGVMRGETLISMNPASQFFGTPSKESDVDLMFEEFKLKHSKKYLNEIIHEQKKTVFTHNLRFIHSKNRANLTYSLAVNHLTDLTGEERSILRGRIPSDSYNGGRAYIPKEMNVKLPDNFNWWLHGAVNPVKDQGMCGSCWSFGATGAVEGAYFLKTGELVRLSQQELMDCSWGEGNNACDGGEDFRAYEWIRLHGQTTEQQYGAYTQQDGYCHYKKVKPIVFIDHWVNVTVNSEEHLRLALFQHGPISVAIDASHRSLSFYSNGVYYEPACKSGVDELDHAVLAVGYGQFKGESYWLIRNSWSTHWGNDGYVVMSSKNNNCGVMTAPTYVILK